MLATRCTRCIKRLIDLFPTWMRLTKVCLIRCPYLFELDDVTFWSHLKQNLLSSSSSIYVSFFSWCATPVLLFSALPRSLTFPSYTIMCVHIIQRDDRARAASIIYFLFSLFFFWLLSRSSLPVLRRPACVPGSKTFAVWACQHALLFSSLPLPIQLRCCRNQLRFVTVTTVYHRLTWLIKPLLFPSFSITEKYTKVFKKSGTV